MQGQPLPLAPAEAQVQKRERVLTQWKSEHGPVTLTLDSIYRDGWLCTSSRGEALRTLSDYQERHRQQ